MPLLWDNLEEHGSIQLRHMLGCKPHQDIFIEILYSDMEEKLYIYSMVYIIRIDISRIICTSTNINIEGTHITS